METLMLRNSAKESPPPERRLVPRNTLSSIAAEPAAIRLLGWLFIVVLIQALFIVFFLQDSARSQTLLPTKGFQGSSPRDKGCENGLVFVYDLPPSFNKELLENCHDLSPQKSRCHAVSNGGFGPKATNLDGIVPGNITQAWYWTNRDVAEVIYHARMLHYKCRTLNPDEATAFYVPFYAGLELGKYLRVNYTAKDRDGLGEMVLNWLQNQPSWKKQSGADHFIMFGRFSWDFRRPTDEDSDWGSSFINMPLMNNVLKITVERNPWDDSEFSVPYPTAFHPRSRSDVGEWQRFIRARNRTSLFSYVGMTEKGIENDFSGLLLDYCKSGRSGGCKAVDCSELDCSEGAPQVLEAFLDSDFCLQPKGEGYTRRSFFDCMLAGAIPVYFWEKSFVGQYDWHMPTIASSYSVFIDHEDVRNGRVSIRSKLEGFSKAEVRRMRETLIDLLPKILYAESNQGSEGLKDAFDVSIERVLRKFHFMNSRKKQSIL